MRSHNSHVRARRPDSTGIYTSFSRQAQKRTHAVGASGNIGRPASRKQEGWRHLTASSLFEYWPIQCEFTVEDVMTLRLPEDILVCILYRIFLMNRYIAEIN